jgi:hypothetical protein
VERVRLDSGGLEGAESVRHVPGGDYAFVGDEKGAAKAKIAREESKTSAGAGAEDDAGAGLEIEGNHL